MRAIKGTAFVIAAQAIFVLLGFVLNSLLARTLGPAGVGAIGLVVAIAMIATTIISAGLSAAATKFISENSRRAAELNRKTLNWQLAISLLFSILIVICSRQLALFFGDALLEFPIAAASLIVPFQVLYSQGIAVANALKRFGKLSMSIVTLGVAKLVVAIGLVFAGYGAVGAIVGYALGPLVASVFTFFQKLERGATEVKNREIINYAVPYSLSALVLMLLQNLDVLAVQSIVKDSTATGLYVAASSISRVFPVLLGSLAVGMFPTISRLSASKAKQSKLELGKYVSTSIGFLIMCALPLVALSEVSSAQILSVIYSDRFIGSNSYLWILLLSGLFTSFVFVFLGILNAIGRTKSALKVSAIFLLLEAVLLWVLTPQFGATGAAFAVLAANIVALLVSGYSIYRSFGFRIDLVHLVKVAALTLFVCALQFFIQPLLPSKWFVLPLLAFSSGVYVFALLKLKVLDSRNLEIIRASAPSWAWKFIARVIG